MESYLHTKIDPLAIPVLLTRNCYGYPSNYCHSLSLAKYTLHPSLSYSEG